MQFDWIDSGLLTQNDTDMLIIEKLCKELNIDHDEVYRQMARQSEVERKKSILGQFRKEANTGEKESGKLESYKTGDPGEDIAKENLIGRIKELKFFTLDTTETVLKEADWLPYICWNAQVSELLSRQNQVLSSEEDNPIDSLLQSL